MCDLRARYLGASEDVRSWVHKRVGFVFTFNELIALREIGDKSLHMCIKLPQHGEFGLHFSILSV